MKRILNFLILILTLVCLCSCSADKGFKISSCSIVSLTPNGLKSVNGVLKLGIVNPLAKVTIMHIDGVIVDKGKVMARFNAESLPLERSREIKYYPLVCGGTIEKGVNVMDLIKLAASRDFSGMTIDLDVKVRLLFGTVKTLKFRDISVSELMGSDVSLENVVQNIGNLAV